MTGQRAGAGAEAAARVRGGDAAAAGADLGGDERALGVRSPRRPRRTGSWSAERRQIHHARAGRRARPSPGSAASAPSRARAGAGRPAAASASASARSSASPRLRRWRRRRWRRLRLVLDHHAREPLGHLLGRRCASASAAAGTGCRRQQQQDEQHPQDLAEALRSPPDRPPRAARIRGNRGRAPCCPYTGLYGRRRPAFPSGCTASEMLAVVRVRAGAP